MNAGRGRPTIYTEELAEEICARLAEGQTLTRIVASGDNMPSYRTVNNWCRDNPDFLRKYASARETQAELYADEIIDIADESQYDITEGDDGKPMMNWEHVKRSALRIDARKWHAAKTYPKKYSERVKQEITGEDGGPIRTERDTPKLEDIGVERWIATFTRSG